MQIIRVTLILGLACFYIPFIIAFGVKYVSFFEDFWCVGITFFSLIFSAIAPYKPKFQSIAVISSEVAMGFNILFTPIWWLILSDSTFQAIEAAYSSNAALVPWGKYLKVSEYLIHSLPLGVSIFELLTTEMVFLHRDSGYLFGASIVYTIFNLVSYLVLKHPVYDVYPLDWKTNFRYSLCFYLAQAPVMWFINEMLATCTQKRRRFIEKDYQNHIDRDHETINGLSPS